MFLYLLRLQKNHIIPLKRILRKNWYPENFIDKCLNDILDNIHIVKGNVPTVEKRFLLLVLPYLGVISLQTMTKL